MANPVDRLEEPHVVIHSPSKVKQSDDQELNICSNYKIEWDVK
jgi:hypothetical protein